MATTSTAGERGGKSELEKWNWGAFLLNWIWAFGHRLWLWGVLGLIPLVNIVVAIMLGLRGNRLAWEKGTYASTEEFRRQERIWATVGAILWVASIVLYAVLAVVAAGSG